MRFSPIPETKNEREEMVRQMNLGPIRKFILTTVGIIYALAILVIFKVCVLLRKPIRSIETPSYEEMATFCMSCLYEAGCKDRDRRDFLVRCDRYVPTKWRDCAYINRKWYRRRDAK